MDQELIKDVLLVAIGGFIGLVASLVVFLIEGRRRRKETLRDKLQRLCEFSLQVKDAAHQEAARLGKMYGDAIGFESLELPPLRADDPHALMRMIAELYHRKYIGRVEAILRENRKLIMAGREFVTRLDAEKKRAGKPAKPMEGEGIDVLFENVKQARDEVVRHCNILENAINKNMPKWC